jgi:hypothetical protein
MTLRPLLAAALLLAACVVSPLERSNYFDVAAGSQLTITADVDSIDQSLGIVTLTVTSTPDFPAERPGATTFLVSGPAIQLDDSRWMMSNAGLFWRPVVIRAFVRAGLPPTADITVWARQRPVDIILSCVASCSLGGVGTSGTISFELRDASVGGIVLPANPYRFGTVDVVTPGVVDLAGRPSASTITVVAVAPGSTWVRLSGEGVSDSILVTVTP